MTIELHPTYPEYLWYPGMLVNATHSCENLAYQLRNYIVNEKPSADQLKSFVRTNLIEEGLGVTDITDEEVIHLIENSEPWPSSYYFADIISRRVQSGWSTHGHSAADVNIYASSPKHAQALIGNHENTEVGNFLRDYLDLDLEPVTKELMEKGPSFNKIAADGSIVSWTGKPLPEGRAVDHMDHYHGDFKRSLEFNRGTYL